MSAAIYVLVDEDPYTLEAAIRDGFGYFTDQTAADAAARELNEAAWRQHQAADRVFVDEWNRQTAASHAGGLLERIGLVKRRPVPFLEHDPIAFDRYMHVYATAITKARAFTMQEGR